MNSGLIGLASLTTDLLDECVDEAKAISQKHFQHLPQYLPLLTEVDINCFAVQISTTRSQIFTAGDLAQKFVLMSVAKPFVLLFLLEKLGASRVFEMVDAIASHQPFNALPHKSINKGKPLNPMLNSGAIALASLMPGLDGCNRVQGFCTWLNQVAQSNFFLDPKMMESVRAVPQRRNLEIAKLLSKFGYVDDAAIAIDTYERFCCLAGSVSDLAKLGRLLTGAHPDISRAHVQLVNAILTTCGLYEASGNFAIKAGLPSKSGVSGSWLSIVPNQGAIACYSPALDQFGNSIFCWNLVQQISSALSLSIFI